MSLKELGEKLREERKRQGLSLDEVQQRSKIAPNVLEAIEEGRQELLPHPVYVKGFLKTYISVLGMAPDDPELGLDTLFEGEEPPRSKVRRHRPLTDVTPYPMQREQKRSNKLLILFILLLLAAGGGFFIWKSLQNAVPPSVEDNATMGEDTTETPVVRESGPAADDSQPSRAVAPEVAPADSSQDNATAANASATASDATNATTTGGVDSEIENIARSIESTASEAENSTEADVVPAAEAANSSAAMSESLSPEKQTLYEQALNSEPVARHAPADGGGQSVQVVALEPCWVGFTLDQDAPKDFYLYAGQRAIVRFDKTLVLRVGNAGGVRFHYNDELFPTNYKSGEVRELRFPPTPE
ncbi:hypothetical protein DPQ33_14255 [Oceanidesulfovibrio indonesiensis]|uniref:Cytoskeleton protein RodZ-like C-terminal domain-containing protein n=1 Tax=Oceanidesulfovibrio indonesiensis TaxID=54767 RepID=A0A7M3MC30_9BACT|nr:RodZ domain-containing protein [Oceanidesulfovibrio indonesiensis]TVM15863.1 hypothetical protein DPQ33_14255 [Oceanidesulfovibrio indonesiensis]